MNLDDVIRIAKINKNVICNPKTKECDFVGCYEHATKVMYYGIRTDYGVACFFKVKNAYQKEVKP